MNLTTSEGVKEDRSKVLIVDDVAFMRLRVANLLKGKGYTVIEETARSLIEVMLGQTVEEFDSLAESGIGELGNVITGLAGSELERLGCIVKITPPTIVRGKNTVISTVNLRRLVIPLITQPIFPTLARAFPRISGTRVLL